MDINPTDISVKWEVVSNTFSNKAQALAAFTIYNNSKITLSPDNWELFFSQGPRNIVSDTLLELCSMRNISGDYYALLPKQNFKLAPGDSVRIEYIAESWYIKESDAPAGLYFVIKTNTNAEQIIAVENYQILPFSKPEQMKRFKYDQEPLATPEWQYTENSRLNRLSEDKLLPIIPQPAYMKTSGDSLVIDKRFYVLCKPELKNEAEFLSKRLNKLTGTEIALSETSIAGKPAFELLLSEAEKFNHNNEAYTLIVSGKGVTIEACGTAGIYYGVQSLLMLFPKEAYAIPMESLKIPQLIVNDMPRYAYRGMHIDVCRNFQTKDEILRVIDVLAMYKLNTLHFYITEDEGWRIEIKSLPELTSFGSKRGHTTTETDMLRPAYGSGPFSDPAISTGTGYYTQDDFKEIIAYAHNNHIRVIPSINFPGHARAAIKSMEVRYNRLMKEGKTEEATKFRLIDPEDKSVYRSIQGYTDNVVDVSLESTYRFFETVVDEVIEMYASAGVPLDMIHTGGDEVPEGVWAKSPSCLELMEKLGNISEAKNLQQYFATRTNALLAERNLKTGGWEEIALTKLPDGKYVVNPELANGNIIPYVWNNLDGSVDLSNRMANAGYPLVFCGVTNIYFDMAYNNDPKEPGLYWGGFIDERKPWELAPENLFITTFKNSMGVPIDAKTEFAKMEKLKPDAAKNIIGLQAQMWAETIHGPHMLEHLLLPKLISFAERAWAPVPAWQNITDEKKRKITVDREWNLFINSVTAKELYKLSFFNGGYSFRVPPPGAIIEDGLLKANSQYPGAKIYYTTDGSMPNENSLLYSAPVEAKGTIILAAVAPGGRMSRTVSITSPR